MMDALEIVGPIAVRRGTLEAICDESAGHEHNYDHVTLVLHGRIRVKYAWDEAGRTIEGQSKEFAAGETVHIKAKVRHTIKALDPNTRYVCIFSHRDFDGLVTQSYVGHVLAAQ